MDKKPSILKGDTVDDYDDGCLSMDEHSDRSPIRNDPKSITQSQANLISKKKLR